LNRRRRAGRAAALTLVVLVGVSLRAVNLGWPPLWVDEAESAINALTILGRGLPLDNYRGLPVFENTLVRPWPGHPEYAFRDISYSDKGLAVYHGWLPLYAMAGAFALAGVTPAEARAGPPPRDASTTELARWTAVPRWPGLAFSALLILCAWRLGTSVAGGGAGWAMALATALGGFFAWTGRQARYYSPTLALTALAGLLVWRALRGGRVRDHALAGLGLALLFHAHALSALVLAAVLAASLPIAGGLRAHLSGVAVAGAVGGALVLPWALWTGFLEAGSRAPAARQMLDAATLVASLRSAGLVWLAGAGLSAVATLARRLPDRIARPLAEAAPGLYFATAWAFLAHAAFLGLVPAASYFPVRLKLSVALPALLIAALALGVASRALARRRGDALVPLAMLAALVAGGQLYRSFPAAEPAAGEHEIARVLRALPLSAAARVYATPNTHLPLTYYSGLPVQSASAVRPSWFERVGPELIVVDTPWYEPLAAARVREVAARHGRSLDDGAARALSREAVRQATLADLQALRLPLDERPRELDGLGRELVDETRRETRRFMELTMEGTPLAAATWRSSNWSQFWQSYFFWFAGASAAGGERRGYLRRAREGRTRVLASGWIVHDCRPRPSAQVEAVID
jgi:hypothetical protein